MKCTSDAKSNELEGHFSGLINN